MSDQITLIIAGSEKVKVSPLISRLSELIKTIIEDSPSEEIPLEQLSKEDLDNIIYYCEKCNYSTINHNCYSTQVHGFNFEQWQREFMNSLQDKKTFNSLIFAAEHLQMKSLLDMLLAYLASLIGNLSVGELCNNYEINEPLREDGEEELLKEYPWVFNL
jgi:hypothetical protein